MEFFSGGNTHTGFYSLFEQTLSCVDRKYILKGSPGCGKSTLLKKIAAECDKRGIGYDLVRCSADTNSLDGIIVHELGFAVADGTAPHLLDVKYPCVRESIVNLGEFWNEKMLIARTDEIMALSDRKSGHFASAYRFLRAAGEAAVCRDRLTSDCFDYTAIEDCACKLLEGIAPQIGDIKYLFSSAFCKNGIETLPTFGDIKTAVRADKKLSFGNLLIGIIVSLCRERGIAAIVSVSPTDSKRFDAVYFPCADTLIYCGDVLPARSSRDESPILASRYINRDAFASVRLRTSSCERFIAEMYSSASEAMSSACDCHSLLENIYIRCMDFDSMNEYTDRFCKRLFDE